MRRRWIHAALAAAVLALGACGAGVAPAARVDEAEVSQASLDDELAAIADNEAYRAALEEGLQAPLAGLASGTWNSDFVAQLLTTRIYYLLLERQVEELGGEVTAADEEVASAQVDEQFASSPETLEALPESYRELLVHQNAVLVAARRVLDDRLAVGQAFYEENRERFQQVCLSHVLIEAGSDADAAEETAGDLADRVRAGESFAAIAAAESDDPSNAQAGGDLGCNARGTFVDEFDDAAWDAQIGIVVGPVQTEFGSHLILVRERPTVSFAQAAGTLDDYRAEVLADQLDDLLFRVACEPDLVEVNSRYGSWDLSLCDSRGSLPSVLPPRGTPAADAAG